MSKKNYIPLVSDEPSGPPNRKSFRVQWKGASSRRLFLRSTFVTVSTNRSSFGMAFYIYLFNVAKAIQTLTRQQLQTRINSSIAIDVKLFIELLGPSLTVQYEFKISFHTPRLPSEKEKPSVYKCTLAIWPKPKPKPVQLSVVHYQRKYEIQIMQYEHIWCWHQNCYKK